jgi:hypothetical protein
VPAAPVVIIDDLLLQTKQQLRRGSMLLCSAQLACHGHLLLRAGNFNLNTNSLPK